MGDFVTLMGAEDVQRAGHRMAQASGEMQSAANTISSELHRMRLFLDDWLIRLEAILKEENEAPAKCECGPNQGGPCSFCMEEKHPP